MSEMVSGGQDASRQADPRPAAGARVARRRGRGRWAAAGAVVAMLAAGGMAAWLAGVFGPDGSPVAAGGGAPRPRRRR